jgi:hypothetical protein
VKQAPELIARVLQQIEAAFALSNTEKARAEQVDLSGLAYPTRASFWMNRCYGRKSSLGISIIR